MFTLVLVNKCSLVLINVHLSTMLLLCLLTNVHSFWVWTILKLSCCKFLQITYSWYWPHANNWMVLLGHTCQHETLSLLTHMHLRSQSQKSQQWIKIGSSRLVAIIDHTGGGISNCQAGKLGGIIWAPTSGCCGPRQHCIWMLRCRKRCRWWSCKHCKLGGVNIIWAGAELQLSRFANLVQIWE